MTSQSLSTPTPLLPVTSPPSYFPRFYEIALPCNYDCGIIEKTRTKTIHAVTSIASSLDCSYAGPVNRSPSYAERNAPAPKPEPAPAHAPAPVNGENDLTRVRSKGSSVAALTKFLDAKVPFRKKVSPESLYSIIILRIVCN